MDTANKPVNLDQENPDSQMTDPEKKAMLSALEARILGALMEKQLTTPDAYPLTLNSLVLACNQKTSREPVMNLQEGAVKRCLYELQNRELVEFEYGSRAEKFDQRLTRALHFSDAERAIFCILLLRGPQTVNELVSRTKRMYEFENTAELDTLLDKLLSKITPLIIKIAQQSGQREARFMHKLCGEPDISAVADSDFASTSSASTPSASSQSQNSSDELVARVEELEKQVAMLLEQSQS